jgi:hypothetical protein
MDLGVNFSGLPDVILIAKEIDICLDAFEELKEHTWNSETVLLMPLFEWYSRFVRRRSNNGASVVH